MAKGGLFDPLDGGFFRYSTDAQWQVPHFEKMLIDNASLARLYYLLGVKERRYKTIADKTLSFINTHLKDHDTGLYYSAMDADSEGGEGAYYLFSKEELEHIDGPLSHLLSDWGLDEFLVEHKAHIRDRREQPLSLLTEEEEALMQALMKIRQTHSLPKVDKKHLLTENALMLSLLSTRAILSTRKEHRKEALALAEAIERHFRLEDGRYCHSLFEGTPYAGATLTDIANLANAYLDLYHVSFSFAHLKKARALLETLLKDYALDNGGFAEALPGESPLRREHITDGADASGSARLLEALLRMVRFFDDDAPLAMATEKFLTRLERLSHLDNLAYLSLWNAALYAILPPSAFLVIDKKEKLLLEAQKRLAMVHHPYESIFYIHQGDDEAKTLSEAVRNAWDDEDSVRLCKNGYCSLPARRFPQ